MDLEKALGAVGKCMVLNGILWILKSGGRWRDLPIRYGNWNSTYHKFRQWSKAGLSGCSGLKDQAIGTSRGGKNTKVHVMFCLPRLLFTFNLLTLPNFSFSFAIASIFITKSKCYLRRERNSFSRSTFGSSSSLHEITPTYSSGTRLKSLTRKVSPFFSASSFCACSVR